MMHAIGNASERNMPYSLATAATACGVNKSTLLRAIQAGKVSAVKDEHGSWVIEPAEVHRVYPPVAERTDRTEAPQQYAPDTQRAELLEQRINDLKVVVEDLRADRDAWRDQAQRLAIAPPEPKARPWWKRLAS